MTNRSKATTKRLVVAGGRRRQNRGRYPIWAFLLQFVTPHLVSQKKGPAALSRPGKMHTVLRCNTHVKSYRLKGRVRHTCLSACVCLCAPLEAQAGLGLLHSRTSFVVLALQLLMPINIPRVQCSGSIIFYWLLWFYERACAPPGHKQQAVADGKQRNKT